MGSTSPLTKGNEEERVKDNVDTHSFQGVSLYVKKYLIGKYNTNWYHGTATYVSKIPKLRLNIL